MEQAPLQVVADFERACADAAVDPLAVFAEAGVHKSFWYRWKRGSTHPTMKNWERVATAFHRLTHQQAA